MNIVYDHQIFSWQAYGGISRYFYEISKRIGERSLGKVEIFAPLYVNRYISNQNKVVVKGVRASRGGWAAKRIDGSLARILLKPRRDIDILHETYYSVNNHCPRDAKRVVTVYDMIHERFSHQFPSRDRTSLAKAKAVRRADHVICISESTRQDLVEIHRVPENKTSVVHLGYSLADDDITHVPQSLASAFRGAYLLYVGQRAGYKNFSGLLKAYASSPLLRQEFALVCFGGGAFTQQEQALMKGLRLSSQQIFQLSGADSVLAALYSSASAFVYPSLYEGFGIPPLEAMSFGCPVVCANTSSIPEVVGGAAEMFDPNDVEDIRNAIERVVVSDEHANSLIARGRERIKLFSWDRCAEATLAVYRKVLEGGAL